MSNRVFNKKEYDQKYYQANKVRLNRRRVENLHKQQLRDKILNCDVDQRLQEVLTAIQSHNETNMSMSNQRRFLELINFSKFFMYMKYIALSNDDKMQLPLPYLLAYHHIAQ